MLPSLCRICTGCDPLRKLRSHNPAARNVSSKAASESVELRRIFHGFSPALIVVVVVIDAPSVGFDAMYVSNTAFCK